MVKDTPITRLTKQLEEGVQQIFNSESWKNYLKMYENFRKYSWQNKLLVMYQNPNASIVKGYRSWEKDFHRTVKKGEKAIKIFAPSSYTRTMSEEEFNKRVQYNPELEKYRDKIENGEVKINMLTFTVANVFDVSQTEGEPLPEHEIRKELKGKVADYHKTLKMLMDIAPCPVSFSNIEKDSTLNNAYGYFKPSDNTIVLRDDMSEEMTVKVLIHEMAHSLLHGKEMLVEGIDNSSFIKQRDIKEIQAESVAYCVCDTLGIDSACESFGYIAEYANADMKKLKNTLEVIDKTVQKITDDIEKYKEKTLVKER